MASSAFPGSMFSRPQPEIPLHGRAGIHAFTNAAQNHEHNKSMISRSTTILAVKRGAEVAVGGDGQVTLENVVAKHNARKVMRLFDGKVLAGVAGSAADAFSLVDLFESKLEESGGNLSSAAVKFARQWRTDRILRQLQAMIIVADLTHILILSGNGDVIEPDNSAAAVGSGASYALAAARALLVHTQLSAEEIVRESLTIAASICIYTNDRFVIETLSE